MSERTVEEVRSEITAERQRLNDDLTALQSEIRSLGVLVAAGLVVVGLVTWRKGRERGVTAVWRLQVTARSCSRGTVVRGRGAWLGPVR